MSIDFSVKEFTLEIARRGWVNRNDDETMKGCNMQQIEALMLSQNVNFLPKTYIEFMSTMGHNAGKIFRGIHYQYKRVLKLKDYANHLVVDCNMDVKLPEDAFFFLDHGGYALYFFVTQTREDNPAVYALTDQEMGYRILHDSFLQLLYTQLEYK